MSAEGRLLRLALPLAALLLAGLGVRPHAGGWNDGSRLAAAESLAERGTLAIDGSVYVQPWSAAAPPFTPGDALLAEKGTLDRIRVGGRFYSDKPLLPSIAMAGTWKVARFLGARPVAEEPRAFARLMGLLFAAVPFALAVAALHATALRVLREPVRAAVLAAAVSFATVAPAWGRQVNGHVLLLALLAALLAGLLRWGEEGARPRPLLLVLGLLLGLAWAVEPGLGPLLGLVFGGLVALRSRGAVAPALLLAGALPPLALHYAVNVSLFGTWLPANAVPAHLAWPGSPFTEETMTGRLLPRGAAWGALYALDLLFGKKGFLLHAPPLLLLLPAAPLLLRAVRARGAAWAEAAASAALLLGTWLLYAATSTNLSGACVSVRWFVPLLAPALLLLAVALRERPALGRDLALLSAFGAVLAALAFWKGPWTGRMLPCYWPIVGTALAAWGLAALLARRRSAERS